MRTLLALLAGCLLTLAAGPAQAHTGSYDMKYVDGSNLILVTLNTHEPVSGLDIEHNIRLYDLVGMPIPYDEVRVEVHTRGNTERLSPAGSSLLSADTLPMLPTNESKETYTYPVSGSYSLTVDFFAGGARISHAEFALDVRQGSTEASSGFGLLPVAGAFLLGIAVGVVFRRRRARSEDPGPASAAPPDDQITDESSHEALIRSGATLGL